MPAVGRLVEDSWAVVGGDGELLMPVHPVSEPGIASLLVENLEKRARLRATLDLSDPHGPLCGKVRLALMGRERGHWVERGAETAGDAAAPAGGLGEAGGRTPAEEAVFRCGERIAFRVTHTHDSPLFLYLLDCGLSGAISIVHPAEEGEQKPLARGGDGLLLGSREGEEITLFLPEGFPFAGMRAVPASGWVETVILFATTRAADFSSLTQSAVRGTLPASRLAGEESPLGRLFRMSMSGQTQREMKMTRPEPDGDWTVVRRSFRLLPG